MSGLTHGRAALVAAVAAGLVYTGSLRNRWALDDHPVIEANPAAHSISAALGAAFSPYWPPEGQHSAGLYRPVTVLSYAVDWVVSGGRPWWFHLTNLVLHGLVTGLSVLVLARWLTPVGSLVAGLVFAVHPVHVEAVANVVGRAELLAAAGMLAAVLAARRHRQQAGPGRSRWLVAGATAVMLAQASKEHAVVAVGILALDHFLDPEPPAASALGLYLTVTAVTVAFLHLWDAVSGDLIGGAAAVPLAGRSTGQRLAAVLPVQFEVLRLLAWPWDLVAEYGPQTVQLQYRWTMTAGLGALVTGTLLLLGMIVRRRAPAVSFGVLASALSYLPTSNLLFVSGVVLAERALYFAVLAPAAVLGWLVASPDHSRFRRSLLVAVGALLIAFVGKTVTRTPFWRDTRTVVLEGFLQHPESFAAHVRLADVREQTGDVHGALSQYLSALALYDGYSFVAVRAARLALRGGRPGLASELAAFARERDPHHPMVARLQADLLLLEGKVVEAAEVAREAAAAQPGNLTALASYREVLGAAGAPAWRQHLAGARLAWRQGRAVQATQHLEQARATLAPTSRPQSGGDCWEIRVTSELARTLLPPVATALAELERQWAQLYPICRVDDR